MGCRGEAFGDSAWCWGVGLLEGSAMQLSHHAPLISISI